MGAISVRYVYADLSHYLIYKKHHESVHLKIFHYYCNQCNYKSYSKQHLIRHKHRHEKCLKNNSFKTETELSKDVNKAEKYCRGKIYECNYCTESYFSEYDLENHIKIQHT